jgi:hypothetical protein
MSRRVAILVAVLAIAGAGTVSLLSNGARTTAAALPVAVTNLKATPTAGGVRLDWEIPGTTNLLHVLVEQKTGTTWSKLPELASTARTDTLSLPPGSYSFRVWAVVKRGSEEASATVAEQPKEEPKEEPKTGAGTVKTRLDAKSAFDSYPVTWFSKLSRLLAYPTAGDRYTHTLSTLAYHDAWTTWGSSGATHVSEYVAKANRDKGAGYAGQFMDDVNFAGGNIAGTRKQYADLIEAIRGAVGPTGVIEINAQYPDIWPLIKAKDPDVLRALEHVDVVTKEFNIGPTSGISSAAKFAEWVAYVDWLHAHGLHTTMTGDSSHNAAADKEYSLAGYLLNNDGGDFIGFSEQGPGKEYTGLSLNLGDATSSRERSSSGIWKRTFTSGATYLAEPGAATQTVQLGKTMHTLEGQSVTSITLSASHGAVLTP